MESVWNAVKTAVKKHIPGHSYKMWIDPIEFNRFDNDNIILNCPNFFSKKRIQGHYGPLIESEWQKAMGKPCKIMVEVAGRHADSGHESPCSNTNSLSASPHPVPVKRDDIQLHIPAMAVQPHTGHLLRKDYTFDNFVVGSNNDFAYSASLSLASRKNSSQNSLFLLSKTGLGKTHLTQAMGHFILSQYPSERVYYITAEDFTNEMIHALRHDSIDKFKERYRRQCDVLLLEDIHFLTGKERTQTELAMVLDNMLESAKKVIFTSCYLPGDIPKMNEQLRSRLSGGLITGIDAPDFQTRVRILRQKSKRNGYDIPRDVTDYLAGELSDNVRQLESGLIGVATRSSLLGTPIDLKLAESVVKLIAMQGKTITIDTIKNLVCRQYGISINNIMSRSRKQEFVQPRQMAIYLARKYTDQPLQVIGKNFNRYHATAIYAINAVEREIKENGALKKQVDYLCQKLDSGNF